MIPEPKFLRRFDQVWNSLRRYQLRLGLGLTLLAAAVGLGLLAWSDHRFELPRATRAAGLAALALACVVVLGRWVVAPLRWWTRPRTAVEIEGRFPQLGQRIRTVVQYAGLADEAIVSEGVAPSLVGALQDETDAKVDPLPLDRVIPRWRVYAVSALAAAPILWLAVLALRSDEWRVALQRAVLVERPYTRLAIVPGNVLVDQGVDVPIAVEVRGRPRPKVILETRPVGKKDAPWKAASLDPPASGPASRRVTTLEKVKDPLEYRVVAGPAESKTFTIDVRYPLVIKTFQVKLTPPAYTGLEPRTVKGFDVQAVEGTGAAFEVAFDGAPSEVAFELTDPARKDPQKGKTPPAPTVLPLRREGAAFVVDMSLVKGFEYRVVAKTTDGRFLPKNKHRVDVYEDRAPRVSFEEPDEALEVHPIAEIKERIRAGDDFGLTKTGIVFRFNDGDETSLILKDFAPPKGKKPQTSAALEETLLMETLAASPQDSVTYYAFAEDNFPGTPRRTETDLRYIDIRPFKRQYKVDDSTPGEGEPEELTTLEELIARQRFNLNRANRLAKHRPRDKTDAEDPLKIAGFEETLVGLTREFTEGIEGIAGEPVEALHRALEAMGAAVEALDRARNDEAPAAMSEALKHLVSARRELITLVSDNPALAAKLRSFDRKQAQKIRKPKNKDEEAEQIAAQLEELAGDEDFVYATLASAMDGQGEKGEKGDPAEPKEAEKKEGEAEKKKEGDPKDSAGSKKGDKGKQGPEGTGEQGKTGPKGEKGQGGSRNPGPGQGDDGQSEPKALDRRALAEKQEQIADTVRDLEEKLKRIQAASDLAKARMAGAAEKAEKASGALARGNSREAAREAKAGAGMLHELARQIRGEIARESADELAMARDLAEELADREADLARMNDAQGPGGPSDPKGEGDKGQGEKADKGQGEKGQGEKGKDGQGEKGQGEKGKDGQGEKGQGEKGKDGQGEKGMDGQGEKDQKGNGSKPGPGSGRGGFAGWDALTEEERIERLAEAARTLESWLKQIDKRGDGKAAEAVHDILEQGTVAEIVERSGRMGELRIGGDPVEVGREAKELADKLDVLGRSLGLLHQGIVAPQLAAMVEFDRRVAELTARLGAIRTDAEIAAWNRDAAGLVRDLEKARVEGAAELADALQAGGRGAGGYLWADGGDHRIPPNVYGTALKTVTIQIKDRIQEMILRDLASARDEAVPPMFREQVDRYYEVLSKGTGGK